MTDLQVAANGLVAHPEPAPLPFGPATVADILAEGVANHPDRLALIDGDETWTYVELDEEVAREADRIGRPDGRAIWKIPSSAKLVIAVLASFRVGETWVATTSDPDLRSKPALGARPAEDLLDPRTPAVIAFTSGTTGAPKQVVHSHQSMLLPAAVSAELEPPENGERIGTPLDLRIANVMILGPLSAFVRGSTFVVMQGRSASVMAADIEQHGVTRLITVPTLAYDLAHSVDVQASQLQGLGRVILGGSGGDPEMLRLFTERFGVRPTLSYGLTEAPTGVVRESLNDPIGSGKGHPLPHVEVIIVEPDSGHILPPGSTGEVCLRPAKQGLWANTWTGTLGYLDEPERTRWLFRGSMLHTGDLGSLDDEGRVSITGRLSNLIVRGGLNVDPEVIRNALVADLAVADASVTGYPDERLGQAIGAVVVADGTPIDVDALAQRTRDRLKPAPGPDSIVVVDELARSAMGKVLAPAPELFAS